jgi:hypothetical protein
MDGRFVLVFFLAVVVLIVLLGRSLDQRERRAREIDSGGQLVTPQKLPRLTRREFSSYASCYILFAVLLAIATNAYFTWSETILTLIGAIMGRQQANRLVYIVSCIILGIGLFAVVLGAEPYLRGGIASRKLTRRFLYVGVPLALFIGLGLLLQTIARGFIHI